MRASILGVVCMLGTATAAFAQKPAEDLTSTVSGRVFCSDTNAPARRATVMLEPVEAAEALKSQERHYSFHGEQVQTLLDGSFTIRHVEPGTYYVVASQSGYLSPFEASDDAPSELSTAPTDGAKTPASSPPRIIVQSGLPVTVNVTLERGASVSGTVLYDDGSPAIGLSVMMLSRGKNGWDPLPFQPRQQINGPATSATTDDQGNYRITALPKGKYLVEVQLRYSDTLTFQYDEHGGGSASSNSGSGGSLTLYSGSKTRQTDAVPFSLSAGEDRHGEDFEIPLSKLHSVRGSIIAAHDGHVLNGANLVLEYADDKSMMSATHLTKDDQEFTFSSVPEGDYILRVNGAADLDYVEKPNPPGAFPPTHSDPQVVRTYGSASQRLHVTSDLGGIVLSVPDVPQNTNQPKP